MDRRALRWRALSPGDAKRSMAALRHRIKAPTAPPPAPRRAPTSARQGGLQYHIEELLHFRGRAYVSGWAFHPERRIETLEVMLPSSPPRIVRDWRRPSPDVEAVHGAPASECRFALDFAENDPADVRQMELVFALEDGASLLASDLPHDLLEADPYHRLTAKFFAMLQDCPGAVLEVGSRNRSGIVRKDKASAESRYVGLDVLPGDNVDVVGDAHQLSQLLEHDQFDMVFTISTFEHLAMPWKVAVEINKVMKSGGLLLVASHQTWPLHEQPWDFWRFSDNSWASLFNPSTGYEIVETAMGERASIVAHMLHAPVIGLPNERAQLASAVLCRKIGPSRVTWDVALEDIIQTVYPQ